MHLRTGQHQNIYSITNFLQIQPHHFIFFYQPLCSFFAFVFARSVPPITPKPLFLKAWCCLQVVRRWTNVMQVYTMQLSIHPSIHLPHSLSLALRLTWFFLPSVVIVGRQGLYTLVLCSPLGKNTQLILHCKSTPAVVLNSIRSCHFLSTENGNSDSKNLHKAGIGSLLLTYWFILYTNNVPFSLFCCCSHIFN